MGTRNRPQPDKDIFEFYNSFLSFYTIREEF